MKILLAVLAAVALAGCSTMGTGSWSDSHAKCHSYDTAYQCGGRGGDHGGR